MRLLSSQNNTNSRWFLRIFLIFGSIVYIALSDIWPILPPLLGVIFVLAIEYYEKARNDIFIFLIPFLIFIESSKNLPFLSLSLFYAICFIFLLPKFRRLFGYHRALIPFFVLFGYFGYFVFLQIMNAIFGTNAPSFGLILLYYAAVELVIVWLFLWVLS